MKILTEPNFIYTLMHSGWRKGVEQFRNRWWAAISFDPSVPEYERAEVTALLGAAGEMRDLLREYVEADQAANAELSAMFGSHVPPQEFTLRDNKARAILAKIQPVKP